MAIARIESFILGKSLSDALKRANAYSKAGADAILIHSKEKTPNKFSLLQKNFQKANITNLWLLYPQHILKQQRNS